MNWKDEFQAASIFASLPERDVARLIEVVEHCRCDGGDTIFEQGSPRQRMLLILDGEVDLMRLDAYDRPRRVVTLAKGDFLGDGMWIDGSVHSTTAVASGPVELAFLHRDRVSEVLGGDLELERNILRNLVGTIVGRLDQLMFRTSGGTHAFASGETRTEHDLLGDGEVPAESYYGIQTLRALQNFDICGVRLNGYPHLVRALAMVKKACALANRDCGCLEDELAGAIADAADEIVAGKLHEHFVVDVIQGGAGTSTNMNANEVLANRALEILGLEKGNYGKLHPNNHVNCSQSTNDVYPTALKLAILSSSEILRRNVEALCAELRCKALEFGDVVKLGRTQLQDAVPMTLGQEFDAFAASLEQELAALRSGSRRMLAINLGGTAIGTGLNAPAGYPEKALAHLRDISGLDLELAPDLIEATQDTQPFVLFSSCLKSLAVKLSKICNDLRLLSSGPRAGFGEIQLPARQPGSSIMPGKVNPVIPEVVNQVAYRVIGNDMTVTMAAEAGQLQLNVMEPVIAANILESLKILSNAVKTLRHNCIAGITANADRCRHFVDNSIGLVTALVPALGYDIASQVATQALESGKGVAEVLRDRGILTDGEIADLIAPERMARPDVS